MSADAQVETLLSSDLDEVLVGADTGGLEGLGAQLLILVGHEVDAEREVVDGSALAAKIVDADLGVGDTTVEPGLGVGLGIIRVSYTVCVPIVQKRFWMDSAGGGLRISAGLRRLVTRRPPQTGSSPTEVQHRKRGWCDHWHIPRLFLHLQTAGHHETMSLSLFLVLPRCSSPSPAETILLTAQRPQGVVAHLVLAVAVATSGTTGHLD